MLTAAAQGGLEVRQESDGSVRLRGRFPYNQAAQLAPGRSEVFAPGSLEPRQDTYLLSQHEFAHPLASTSAGTLEVRQEQDALAFTAILSPEVAGTSHGRDAVALIRSGLAVGLSPGFRVPSGGERVERRGDELVRTVTRAELHELSIVTRPAFATAEVEARRWQPENGEGDHIVSRPPQWRWR
jgi:HK97 family phage prohead protease